MSNAGFRDRADRSEKPIRFLRTAVVPVVFSGLVMGLIGLSGCGSGKGTAPTNPPTFFGQLVQPTPTPTPVGPTPTPSPTPTGGVVGTGTITSTGGRITFNPTGTATGGGQVFFDFPANSLPAGITTAAVSVTEVGAPSLTSLLNGGTYILGFTLSTVPGGITQFSLPITVSAAGVSNLSGGTILNLARIVNGQLTNVGTVLVDGSGGLRLLNPTTSLPGLTAPGQYVIYLPASGTNTAQANFGVVLVSDDNSSGVGLQVFNIFDNNGSPLATPTKQNLPFANARDIDGQGLTPDASQGILVDGGNTIRFFSGLNTGKLVASTKTVDISAYGGDGDAVAIMPNGDTAVVSGDSDVLLVVSGIVSGNPVATATIQLPRTCDGVVISNDGKVLLARGQNGLTVFSIIPATPAAGPLGGTLSYTFTQTNDQPTLGTSGAVSDGRCGMAFSPADSSRAVIVAAGGGGDVALLTGLPGSTTVTRKAPRLLQSAKGSQLHRAALAAQEQKRSRHQRKSRLAPTGARSTVSVSVTPDGTSAVVGTEAGLILFSGINTGTLTQVGQPFNPTITGTTEKLDFVPTLGISLDGRYVAAMTENGGGTLLVIPLIPGQGFGAAVGQLSGVEVPSNDQLIVH